MVDATNRATVQTSKTRGAMVALSLLFIVASAQAEVTVAARLDRGQAEVGEQVLLTLAVTSNKALSIQVPPTLTIPGAACSQVRGPATSDQVSLFGGRLLRRVVAEYAYFLTMQRAGDIEIPSIPVIVEGAQYATQPIRLRVGKSAVADAGGPVQVRVNVNPTSVYQGEPILVEYLLYEETSAAGRIQNRQLARDPAFTNFWVETVDDIRRKQTAMRREVVNGVPYAVTPILRYVVFPTRAGTLTIPSVSVSVLAALPTGARNIFGEPILQARQINVSSPERTIQARSLPTNPPPGFGGAVGSFSINASVDRNEVSAGDPITWTLTIEGNGNVRSVGDLNVPEMKEFRTYDPKTSTTFSAEQGKARGKFVYERVVMPLHAGFSQIPGVAFAYFDPGTGRYETAVSAPQRITVTAGRGGATAAGSLTGRQTQLKEVGADIRFIQPDASSLKNQTSHIPGSSLYWFSYLVPASWLLVAFCVRLRRSRQGANPARMRALGAAGEARKRLKSAKTLLDRNDLDGAIQAVAHSLTELIAGASDSSAAGLTATRTAEILESHRVPEDLRRETLATLQRCDQIRFAPNAASSEEAKVIYDDGFALMRQLLKYLLP